MEQKENSRLLLVLLGVVKLSLEENQWMCMRLYALCDMWLCVCVLFYTFCFTLPANTLLRSLHSLMCVFLSLDHNIKVVSEWFFFSLSIVNLLNIFHVTDIKTTIYKTNVHSSCTHLYISWLQTPFLYSFWLDACVFWYQSHSQLNR